MAELFIFIIGAMVGGCVSVFIIAACILSGREDEFREELERRANDDWKQNQY